MNQKETDVNLSIDNGKGTHHSKRDNIDFFNIYYLFLKDRKKNEKRNCLFAVEQSIGGDVFAPDDFLKDFFIASVSQFDSFLWWDEDEFEEAVEITGAPEDIDDGEHQEEWFVWVDEVHQTPDEGWEI